MYVFTCSIIALHACSLRENRAHLQKAGETPFAHGDYYEQLRGPSRDNVMEDILTGETEWAHPMEEVDAWIEHLKYQYNCEDLQEEAKKLAEEITYEEFRKYFRKRRERTESSESGRHMGHYKDKSFESIDNLPNFKYNAKKL